MCCALHCCTRVLTILINCKEKIRSEPAALMYGSIAAIKSKPRCAEATSDSADLPLPCSPWRHKSRARGSRSLCLDVWRVRRPVRVQCTGASMNGQGTHAAILWEHREGDKLVILSQHRRSPVESVVIVETRKATAIAQNLSCSLSNHPVISRQVHCVVVSQRG